VLCKTAAVALEGREINIEVRGFSQKVVWDMAADASRCWRMTDGESTMGLQMTY
jgi:hypothetical protein